jgi:6-phosphofructokinase
VSGWASRGGSALGTTRRVPKGRNLYAIARVIEDRRIDALLIIGGWNAYESVFTMLKERPNFPSFNIPMICLPASINNNLPGSEFSIGADTALNSIVDAVDKIKQSAVATRRCFVVEVMGNYCGYLALMGGMATGAERVYMHEEGVRLRDLQEDVEKLLSGFQSGKRLGLMIRNERANEVYNTEFICSLFEEEGRDVFDVRHPWPSATGRRPFAIRPHPGHAALAHVPRASDRPMREAGIRQRLHRDAKRSNPFPRYARLRSHDRLRTSTPQGTMVAGVERHRQPAGKASAKVNVKSGSLRVALLIKLPCKQG